MLPALGSRRPQHVSSSWVSSTVLQLCVEAKTIASATISLPLLISPCLTLAFPIPTSLLQRNKPRTVCRANTGPSVLDRLVANAELAQIKPHHLWLDLDLVELLA
jgi:hypothetical protein